MGNDARGMVRRDFKTLTAGTFYRLLQRLTDVQIPVDAGDFRLMSRARRRRPQRHARALSFYPWHGELDWHETAFPSFTIETHASRENKVSCLRDGYASQLTRRRIFYWASALD